MTNEEIEKFRLGYEKDLQKMSQEEFDRIYKKWEDLDHNFTKEEKTVLIALLAESFEMYLKLCNSKYSKYLKF